MFTTMKRFTCLFLGMVAGISVMAQENEGSPRVDDLSGPFGIEAPLFFGASALGHMGLHDFDSGLEELDEILEALAALTTINLGITIDGGWRFTESLSAGVELGGMYGALLGDIAVLARVFGRAELGALYAQPHLGTYILIPDIVDAFSTLDDFSEPLEAEDFLDAASNAYFDVGVKVGVISGKAFKTTFFAEAAYMIGDHPHLRVGIGGGFLLRG